MKTNPFKNVPLSILFHATLLSTMFVMPLVLAARHDAGMATAGRDARVWDRSPDVPAKAAPQRDVRLPRGDAPAGDAPASGPAARQIPIDKSGPDAEMIKPGKVRAKTIKV